MPSCTPTGLRGGGPAAAPSDEVLRHHEKWVDGFAFVWLVITVGVLVGGRVVFDSLEATPDQWGPVLILLATVAIAGAVWRAAGMTAAQPRLASGED